MPKTYRIAALETALANLIEKAERIIEYHSMAKVKITGIRKLDVAIQQAQKALHEEE